jgi:hypothetical protein
MSTHEETMEGLKDVRTTMADAGDVMKRATEEIGTLRAQVKFYKAQYDLAKARSTYPEFCKHPGKCAGAGRCMADWVCND